MKKRYVLFVVVLLFVLSFFYLWPKRNAFLEKQIENWVNQEYEIFLNHSFELEGFRLENDLTVSISRIKGKWLLDKDAFPFEISEVEVLNPISYFLWRRPVTVRFQQLRPQDSSERGIHGTMLLLNDEAGTFELRAEFGEVYLEDYTLLNPENLEHATGRIEGYAFVRATATATESMQLQLGVKPPGGKVQARFFEGVTPYLPAAQKQILAKIRSSEVVDYEKLSLNAELAKSDEVKMLLQIGVPEYNLNLNLNLTLRVENQEAFYQLAGVMGLIKVETK